MKQKTKTCLLRLTEKENSLLSAKSAILGTTKSELFRNSAFHFWNGKPNATRLLEEYQNSDDIQKSVIVDLLFEYYRRKGYPHNILSDVQSVREMKWIANSKSPLLENDHLQSNTLGLALPNYYHPHTVKVKCLKNYRSPYEQFINDDLFKDAIKRWMDLGKKPSASGLRRILRTRDRVRSVVNFKPVVAKFLYDLYCPNNGRILDPCAGYGGRLAGAISGNRNLFYHGIDPHGPTAVGNMQMASFFSKYFDMFGREWKFDFRFDLGCAEDVMPMLQEKYDLICTSPPYYDTEKYSNEPTQSYLKFPIYEKWVEGFLKVIIVESKRILNSGGHLVLNVKNYKKTPIADDTLRIADEIGFKLDRTFHQRMANNEYQRVNKDDPNFKGSINWHTEPIFVFQKKK